jgi:hypothetical protein
MFILGNAGKTWQVIMNGGTVELLETAVAKARQSGIEVRYAYLDGISSGYCRLGKRQILFIDLSLSVGEQLDQVMASLHTARNDRASQ